MKKLLVVLLALGLIAAIGTTASAVDVKFAGQYYVVGAYDNNQKYQDVDNTYSKAYFYQRTRIQTVFQAAEGLSLTTRFDALEKQWGRVANPGYSKNATGNVVDPEDKTNSRSATAATLQESIEFEQAYVTFKTAVGQFQIGYQDADVWGTVFADTPCSRPRAIYTGVFGPVVIMGVYEKWFEADSSSPVTFSYPAALASPVATVGKVDADSDTYALAAIYNFKGGAAGLLYKYFAIDVPRLFTPAPYRTRIHYVAPYLKGTFGPVYVEAEFNYLGGKAAEFDGPGAPATGDIDKEGYGAYALAKVNLGPAYVGGQFGWSSGDDGSDPTKDKTGPISSTSWVPALIWGNFNLAIEGGVSGGTTNANGVNVNYNKQNLLLLNGFAGFNVTPKINIEGAVTWMQADKKPTNYVSKDYGIEADLKATYKIYDNLSYMVGAGYLWTGDYYKGTKDSNTVGNDYVLMNQLTLNF